MTGSHVTIKWLAPWRAIHGETEILGVQLQLEREVTVHHSLHNRAPRVIGRRIDNDEVLVVLDDGTYANVRLVWGSGVVTFPDQYPSWFSYGSLESFLAAMAVDAAEHGEE